MLSPFGYLYKCGIERNLDSRKLLVRSGEYSVIDEEQVWIAKYRLTLNATPIEKSKLGAFAARLNGVIQGLLSGIAKAFHRQKSNSLRDVKRFEGSCLRIAQPRTLSEPDPQIRSRESVVRNPRKQHLLRQPRRRRAS